MPRSDDELFQYAINVMKFHASRKSVLEIEYVGEEGTGLGPTLEFYALVAAEFQRKSLALWLCDDDDVAEKNLETELDLGEGLRPPGFVYSQILTCSFFMWRIIGFLRVVRCLAFFQLLCSKTGWTVSGAAAAE